mmetsp:Transcript_32990/g.49837  ORF Transcript_32990/g.49837 Transcript_32990/m.49837 type:complete len:259 (-) Transcript_32990:99-875(-)|eukprot:CAMPEP_0178897848 /NCGR_PEP_ID=MMETSP0786-20121207/1988_1 /TAXON_ID=186022 /ORGANISM="Thalassionema frauenfeldii, Strain CCMP 1798" /LENGTH=258 /DNA_ID=CAMNT_0020568471 /DNA_START=260 /DNA_END=1036 /DNA_ORIENTATION=-
MKSLWVTMLAMKGVRDSCFRGQSLLKYLTSTETLPPFVKKGRCVANKTLFDFSALLREIRDKGARAVCHNLSQKNLQYGSCILACNPVYSVRESYQRLFLSTFDMVIESMDSNGYKTELNRFDLFHGHLFHTQVDCKEIVGILFHCYEYPNSDVILKDVNLGFCQAHSCCSPSLEEWRYRNVIWVAWWCDDATVGIYRPPTQKIFLLDGSHKCISDLRVDATKFGPNCPNTVWEGHFGNAIGDVYHFEGDIYLANIPE